MSTIAAVATAPGPGARGVIRVSGPEAGRLVRATFAPGAASAAPSADWLGRRAVLPGRFDDGRGTQPALLFWMPGPGSYTREDVAEFHLVGSPPLLDAALARLLAEGAELAQPGEFTRRAFEHGRLDLSRAEGVLALVEAENARQARAAAELLFGGLAERVDELRDGLEEVRALCEASLDFDESDTGHVAEELLLELGWNAAARLREALSFEERREPLSGLPRLALVGAPNAGKSSLFNRLAGADALVSSMAGTTRDGVAGVWRLAGLDCRLLDTPGLDEGLSGEADTRAQELARDQARGSDLLLFVASIDTEPEALAEVACTLPKGPRLLVWNKLDLAPPGERSPPAGSTRKAPPEAGADLGAVSVSALTGAGLGNLAAAVVAALGLGSEAAEPLGVAGPAAGPGVGPAAGPAVGDGALGRELSVRHRHALELAAAHLDSALGELAAGAPLDLVAQGLRSATDALDAVSGRTTPEDLLDRIFARFCLGK